MTTLTVPAASPGSRDLSGGCFGWWRNGVNEPYARRFQETP